MSPRPMRLLLAAAALAAAGSLAPWAEAQDTEGDIRLEEARTALEAALERAGALAEELAAEKTKTKNLAESLAAANAESEQYRGEYQRIRTQLEALGVDVLRKDSRGLDKRLLNAVSDLRLADERNRELTSQLVALSEAVIAYMGSSVSSDVPSRSRLESVLRATSDALDAARPPTKIARAQRSLDDIRVVGVKSEFGLVVLDAGEDAGVRVGMPLRLNRKDKPVASALVVDVRDAIAGAIVTDLIAADDRIQVGDTARLETQHPSNP